MKKIFRILLFSALLYISTGVVYANQDRGLLINQNRKTALVIGNGNYASASLKNPVNDARDMADLLKGKGFDTMLVINGSQKKMEESIRKFGKKIMRGGVGLFYYAGHGMQVNGTNYLIPVGADIDAEDEVKYESVNTNMILSKMETAGNSLNMIFLDACRNNPFSRSFRSGNRGLAQMDVSRGALIAFSTAPGNTAADGDGRNGLFTKHLLKKMNTPGLEISSLLKSVRKSVRIESGNKQVPWDVSSLEGDFYFTPGKKNKQRDTTSPASDHSPALTDEDSETWTIVKTSRHLADFEYYLSQFPDGKYRKAARIKIMQLKRKSEDLKPTEKSIAMDKNQWRQVAGRNPHAKISYRAREIILEGAGWTNGRKRNGYVDGNGIQSIEKFNFTGKTVRLKFKMLSTGNYSAVDVRPLHLPMKSWTSNNSWAGSYVIRSDQWYYQTILINRDGWWEAKLSTGNYYDENGKIAYTRSGRLTEEQLNKLKNSEIIACFGDNYAGSSAYLFLGEAVIKFQ